MLVGFSIAAPVGPIGVLCIRRTISFGRISGLVTGLGAATADACYGVVAAFGLTVISNFLVGEQLSSQKGPAGSTRSAKPIPEALSRIAFKIARQSSGEASGTRVNSSTHPRIPAPPTGWNRVKSFGPGFLWVLSAAASGELLFTPRTGAQYGDILLWAFWAAGPPYLGQFGGAS